MGLQCLEVELKIMATLCTTSWPMGKNSKWYLDQIGFDSLSGDLYASGNKSRVPGQAVSSSRGKIRV